MLLPCSVAVQVRVNFLTQLLHEGRSHLQQYLTASVLGRKVFCLPFHRGIQLDGQALASMKAALAYCQKVGHSTCILGLVAGIATAASCSAVHLFSGLQRPFA